MDMLFDKKLEIMGVKQSVWSVDGRSENTTLIFAKISLKSNDELKAFGSATETFKYKSSVNIDEFAGLQFPFHADCQLEMVTTGKNDNKSKDFILHTVKPINPKKLPKSVLTDA